MNPNATQANILSTAKFFKAIMNINGQGLSKLQSNHIMAMYFVIEGLHLTQKLTQSNKEKIKDYILSLEIPTGGWAPSSYYTQFSNINNQFFCPHIVFTYSAINILTITGGLQKINKQNCLLSLQKCQRQDGSYSNFYNSSQADLRFVYASVSICHSLADFSKMNKEKVIEYIKSCQNFDGGYGLRPNCQSHSGAIYCAISSLKMLNVQPLQKNRTLLFLVNRQTFNTSNQQIIGLQGRVGKNPDSCYTFWVGASICLLTGQNLLNPHVQQFVNLCYKPLQCSYSKYPLNEKGDFVHTMHSISGLKIINNDFGNLILQKGIKKVEDNKQLNQ